MQQMIIPGRRQRSFIFFFFFFLSFVSPKSMWDFWSPARDGTMPPAVEVWHLNHWTTRGVPIIYILMIASTEYQHLAQPKVYWPIDQTLASHRPRLEDHIYHLQLKPLQLSSCKIGIIMVCPNNSNNNHLLPGLHHLVQLVELRTQLKQLSSSSSICIRGGIGFLCLLWFRSRSLTSFFNLHTTFHFPSLRLRKLKNQYKTYQVNI